MRIYSLNNEMRWYVPHYSGMVRPPLPILNSAKS